MFSIGNVSYYMSLNRGKAESFLWDKKWKMKSKTKKYAKNFFNPSKKLDFIDLV